MNYSNNSIIYLSVILPAYNTPSSILERAIKSVINQTYPYFEFIIVDDGSFPSLEPIVKKFNDERIIYIRHGENKGTGVALNTGIRSAKYDWIAIICHDDEWLPDKLEVQVEIIKKNIDNSNLALIYTDVFFYENDTLRNNSYGFKCITDNFYENCLTYGFISASTIVIKKQALYDIGLYDESGVLIDWDLYIRLSAKYSFYCICKKLVNYYHSSIGISHPLFENTNVKACNDIIKLYFKWKKEIFKYKNSKKLWSVRLNSIAKIYLERKQKKQALKLYYESLKLNPFWLGNYFDVVKYFILFKKP